MKKIIGVNTSHNASACLLENGIVKEYWDEDRLLNKKDWIPEISPPTKELFCLNKIFDDEVEMIAYACPEYTGSYKVPENVHKKYEFKPYFFDSKKHHLYHAICGFYFSPFKEATCIVIDGGGSEPYEPGYREIESIISINKNYYTELYKKLSIRNNLSVPYGAGQISDFFLRKKRDGCILDFTLEACGGLLYDMYSYRLGFFAKEGTAEVGKLMGLSSYLNKEKEHNLDKERVQLAAEVQEESLKRLCYLIKSAREVNKSKNIILSGGCALNCVNNFKVVKEFPELNFFVDPIPHDGGTAIGVAKYIYDYSQR